VSPQVRSYLVRVRVEARDRSKDTSEKRRKHRESATPHRLLRRPPARQRGKGRKKEPRKGEKRSPVALSHYILDFPASIGGGEKKEEKPGRGRGHVDSEDVFPPSAGDPERGGEKERGAKKKEVADMPVFDPCPGLITTAFEGRKGSAEKKEGKRTIDSPSSPPTSLTVFSTRRWKGGKKEALEKEKEGRKLPSESPAVYFRLGRVPGRKKRKGH